MANLMQGLVDQNNKGNKTKRAAVANKENYSASQNDKPSHLNSDNLTIDLTGCTAQEIEFFEKVKALIEGETVFKKFNSGSSMAQKPFNPLEKGITPEQKGYGKRVVRVNSEFSKIEIIKPNEQDKNSAFTT